MAPRVPRVGSLRAVRDRLGLPQAPRHRAPARPARIDWWGNLTFAVGLVLVLVGITYGIEPYGSSSMGWGSPRVLTELIAGVVVLGLFAVVETKVADPMFRLHLFRIRAFTAGNFASLLSSLGRGGLFFLLIIWLQGIWLPEHGYSFAQTPLWAGIYMVPLTIGFLVAGPLSGLASDRFGARPFATGGMVGAALSFGLLELLPVDFSYLAFAALLLLNGLAMGLFAAPNRAGIMNSLPPDERGAGVGHGHNVPKCRPGALDRHLLQPRRHRPDVTSAAVPARRAHLPRRPPGDGGERGPPASGGRLVCCLSRLQPSPSLLGPSGVLGPAPERRTGPPCLGTASSRT